MSWRQVRVIGFALLLTVVASLAARVVFKLM